VGGSFDPPHLGHLALARSARVALGLDRVWMMPTGMSWQKAQTRDEASASPAQRLAMLERLIPDPERAWLDVDPREVRRFAADAQPTYTIDTLRELAQEYPDTRRVLILGADQLRNLATWKDYEGLLNHAHLAVTTRPGFGLRQLPPVVEGLLRDYGSDHLGACTSGSIVIFAMPPVPVSSTDLRRDLARNTAPVEFLGAALLDYIREEGLYRGSAFAQGA